MDTPKETSVGEVKEDMTLGVEQPVTSKEEPTEILDDDGEVFKMDAGKARFRALGLYVKPL